MILVIAGIFLALAILGGASDDDEIMGISAGLFAVCIIAIIILISLIVGGRVINDKIEMYQDENASIETKVKETVRAYMEFEEKTYTELVKDADLTTLLVKYPELNSNELVKTEILLYVENNSKIKELKEQQINLTVYKWWLYFGK